MIFLVEYFRNSAGTYCFLQSYPQLQPGEAAGRDIWIGCQSSSAFRPKSSSILIITSSYTPPRRRFEAWGGKRGQQQGLTPHFFSPCMSDTCRREIQCWINTSTDLVPLQTCRALQRSPPVIIEPQLQRIIIFISFFFCCKDKHVE